MQLFMEKVKKIAGLVFDHLYRKDHDIVVGIIDVEGKEYKLTFSDGVPPVGRVHPIMNVKIRGEYQTKSLDIRTKGWNTETLPGLLNLSYHILIATCEVR